MSARLVAGLNAMRNIVDQVIMITHYRLLFTTPYTAGCDMPNTLAIIC